MEYILVTGGLGFIGSHVCVELLNSNYNVVVIDNLFNSTKKVKQQIEMITNKKLLLYTFDLLDLDRICYIFNKHKIKAVVHLAGLKSVNESINNPLLYYNNNITITLNLLITMERYNCNRIIFSSSATVYGSSTSPMTENSKVGDGITNPYGKTKFIIESMLLDLFKSDESKGITILRYFNPIGAHETGLIGESPNNIPNNIMPYILKVAEQNNNNRFIDDRYSILNIFGNDYPTNDGTCIRDYIHVVDLAKAHVKALDKMITNNTKLKIYNLGTGIGTSVLELIEMFEKINNVKIPYQIVGRREGDRAELYCKNNLAVTELEWEPVLTLEDMCKDSWEFECTMSNK